MSVYARFTYTVQRHLEGSILLKWVIWHVTPFFACRAQDYTFLSANCAIHAFG